MGGRGGCRVAVGLLLTPLLNNSRAREVAAVARTRGEAMSFSAGGPGSTGEGRLGAIQTSKTAFAYEDFLSECSIASRISFW